MSFNKERRLTMKTILSKALREFTTGPLNQLIVNLGGQDGDQWEQQLKRFLRKEPCWSEGGGAQAPAPKPRRRTNLLEFVGTVLVPATTGKFVAKDKFMVNTLHDAPVKISKVGDNFTKWFLCGDGKTEDPISEQTLRYAKLRKASVDSSIIEELGGEAKAETMLFAMFSLMEEQRYGKKGVLLNNEYANIFHIPDKFGVLRAVYVRWNAGGWHVGWYVDAFLVGDSFKWLDGDRVFGNV